MKFIRWQVQLRFVKWRTEISWRLRQMGPVVGSYDKFERSPWCRFIEWASPWTIVHGHTLGYRRVLIRRIVFRLRFPRWYAVCWFWSTAHSLLLRIAPYTGPGRLEGMDPATQLKVGWLDANNEIADKYEGGGDYPLSQFLFANTSVPWSRQAEHWIVEHEEIGFVSGVEFDSEVDARVSFAGFESQVAAFFATQEGDDDRDPTESYGTPEHEAWLVEMERMEG